MGYNTVVVLLNDQTERWPDEIFDAWTNVEDGKGGYFGWGQVVSCAHADQEQLVMVSCNTGSRILPAKKPVWTPDLHYLAYVLRTHGYSVEPPESH